MDTVQGQIERALTALREARRRGRPAEQDQALARAGYLPVAVASAILGKKGSTLYKARDKRRLVMRQVSGYWYVHEREVVRYSERRARTQGVSDAR